MPIVLPAVVAPTAISATGGNAGSAVESNTKTTLLFWPAAGVALPAEGM